MVTKNRSSHLRTALAAGLIATTPALASIDQVTLTVNDAEPRTYVGRDGSLEREEQPVGNFTIAEDGCFRVEADGDAPAGEVIDYRLIDPNDERQAGVPLKELFHNGNDEQIPPLDEKRPFQLGDELCLSDILENGKQRFTAGDVLGISVRQETSSEPSSITESVEYYGIVTGGQPPETSSERTGPPANPAANPAAARTPKPTLRATRRSAPSESRKAVYAAFGPETRSDTWTDECAGSRERSGDGGAWAAGFEYLSDRLRIDLSARSVHTEYGPEGTDGSGPVPPVVVDGNLRQLILKGDYRLWDGTVALGVPFALAHAQSRLEVDDIGYGADTIEVGSGLRGHTGIELIIAPQESLTGFNLRLGYVVGGDQRTLTWGDRWGPIGKESETILVHGPSIGMHAPFGQERQHRLDLQYTQLNGTGDAEGASEQTLEAGLLFRVYEGREGDIQVGGRLIKWDRELPFADHWETSSTAALLEARYNW